MAGFKSDAGHNSRVAGWKEHMPSVAALKSSGWARFILDIGGWGEWQSRYLKGVLSVMSVLEVVPFNVHIHDSAAQSWELPLHAEVGQWQVDRTAGAKRQQMRFCRYKYTDLEDDHEML